MIKIGRGQMMETQRDKRKIERQTERERVRNHNYGRKTRKLKIYRELVGRDKLSNALLTISLPEYFVREERGEN